MSGATEAADALRAALASPLAGISTAVKQAIHAQGLLRHADDLVPVMQAAVAVALAAEAVETAAKEAAAQCRAALAAVMADTGCGMLHTDTHTAGLRAAPRSVQITDTAAIPPDLMTTPAPAPNKAEIAKRLKAGEPVPGAVLSNGGPDILSIRSKAA